jgi:hypothetical protein
MRPYQRPRQIQNTQENHGLMMIAKTPSKIAKSPNDSSESILHRTTSAISASSGRKLEEHSNKIGALPGVILFLN